MTTQQYSQQATSRLGAACFVVQSAGFWACTPYDRWMRTGYGSTAEQAINDCFVKNN